MDALVTMIQLEKDARKFGFDWPDQDMVIEQTISECQEVATDIQNNASKAKIQEEVGDVLHAAISLCLYLGYDIEDTLSKTNQKFATRMHHLKALARQRGHDNLRGQPIEFMLKLWHEAKQKQYTDSQSNQVQT